MAKVYIWGCSDDLICVTGDIDEEFYGENHYVVFDNGSMIKIAYDYDESGNWTVFSDIDGLNKTTRYRANSPEAVEITKGRDYSDVVVVEGNFTWLSVAYKVVKVT